MTFTESLQVAIGKLEMRINTSHVAINTWNGRLIVQSKQLVVQYYLACVTTNMENQALQLYT